MNKKVLIVAAGVGLVSFAAAFAVAFVTGKSATPPPTEQAQTGPDQNQGQLPGLASATSAADSKRITMALTERQLEALIGELREKVAHYDNKLKQLETDEQHFQIAQDTLKADIDKLTELRTEIASMVAALRQRRDELLRTRIEIEQSEQQNLISIAATYDKMQSASASEIFTNMTRLDAGNNAGLHDVLKIMYYMTDRTKAKVLAELVTIEPKLAAVLSRELKRVKEVTQ